MLARRDFFTTAPADKYQISILLTLFFAILPEGSPVQDGVSLESDK